MPLLALGLAEPPLFVAGVTGSTGSGRKPVEGTHHPLRHSDLYSYDALAHRHAPEIAALRRRPRSGVAADVRIRAALGPFRARHPRHGAGDAEARRSTRPAMRRARCASTTRHRRSCACCDGAPRVKDVATSNYAHLGAAPTAAPSPSCASIDNLNKGAAGGAVQWMNRLLGLAETAGLTAPAPGWT